MNVLAIGAHFDDVEIGCGGALAKHSHNGDNVYIYVATNSGFQGTAGKADGRSNEDAFQEGVRAAKLIGGELICGGKQTLHLEFNDELNYELVKLIDKYNINLIYTHWDGDVHHDHVALSRATLHSARHVPRILMYQSNWYHSTHAFSKNFYVNISNYWDIKEQAICAYESEMNRTNGKWIPYFKNDAMNNGCQMGVLYAEAFQLVKWLE